MPNLAGMFDMTSRTTDTAAVVGRMERVLNVPGVDYTRRFWSDARFAAVNLLNGISGNLDQPATASGETVLFLDGEICNLAELKTLATRDLASSPARACLALYIELGEDFVAELDGQFNILIYDIPGRSVKVLNDRLAYRPFYYWSDNGLALFALEKKAIFAALGRTPPFDAMGILEFAAFGHNLDDRTLFDGVQVMSHGSILEFRDSRAKTRRYWRPKYRSNATTGSLENSAQELGERLCRAAKRRTGLARRYGVFLSGGLDSRATAGALARTHNHVASFTFGSDDSPDLKFGRRLAGELGFAFQRLRYEDVSLARLLPQVVWRTEGSVPFNQPLSIAHHGCIRTKADVIFNGHFGDVLSGGHLMPELIRTRNVRQLADLILKRRTMIPFETLGRMFKRSFLVDAYEAMRSAIERRLHSLDEDSLALTYNLWDMTVRQRRFTFSSPAVDRYIVEQVTPLIDKEVLDFMLGMPIRYLIGQRLYKRMIMRTFPETGKVPWTRTGRTIPTNLWVDFATEVQRFARTRLRRLASGGRGVPLDRRVHGLRSAVEGGVEWDALPGDVLDRDAVRGTVSAAVEGNGPAVPMFAVLTLTECARLFPAGGVNEPPIETLPDL